MKLRPIPAIFLYAFILSGCASLITDGGGSRGGNPVIIGRLIDDDGTPASYAVATLHSRSYNPVTDARIAGTVIDTADGNGNFSIFAPDTGWYTIQSVSLNRYHKTRSLINNIRVLRTLSDTVIVSPDTLRIPGNIKVVLNDSMKTGNGYFYIPGTSIFAVSSVNNDYAVLDSVPAGKIPSVCYATNTGPLSTVLRYDIPVSSGDTVTLMNLSWKYAHALSLNTASGGANVAGNVTGFPALIRLNSGNFDFSQAKVNGGDIRFAKANSTPLPYQIERWDAAQAGAEIWVKVDTVYGNNDTQSITMYWGNPDAADSSNGTAVFDTANGFQGVWHMDEAGAAAANDATGNHFDGTPAGMSSASAVPGVIGHAQEFNGTSSYISVPNTANGKLNFPENGHYTLSAWVYADTLDSTFHQIISKGDRQYGLQLHNINKWEINEFHDATGWETVRSPATAQAWKYIVGVRDGAKEYLYVDGALASDSIITRDTTGRNTTFNLCIGRQADVAGRYWKGKIDEVNMADLARTPDWIRLCYMNQQAGNKLVEFR